MSSAFKNFFITFIACLIVFAFVAWQWVYPAVKSTTDNIVDNNSSASEETSAEGETSEPEKEEPVAPVSNYNENGKDIRLVVMAVDGNGCAVTAAFIDVNERTSRYIYSPINVNSVRMTNSVGELVPLCDLFAMLSDNEVCAYMTAYTGLEVDYCIRYDRSSMQTLAASVPGANISLLEEKLQFVNPKYQNREFEEDEELPADYYIVIENVDGKVNLNEKTNGKTKLEWLLGYTPYSDGAEYNDYYIRITRALMKQFIENAKADQKAAVLGQIRSSNLNKNGNKYELDPDLYKLLFKFKEYKGIEKDFPATWDNAHKVYRELDGEADMKK